MVWQSTEYRKGIEFTLVGQREDTLNIQASSRATETNTQPQTELRLKDTVGREREKSHGFTCELRKQSSKDRRCDCRRAVCWGWGLHENLREGVLQGCIIEQWQLMILVRPACKKPTSSCGIFSIFPLLPAYLRAFLHISHDFRVQRKAKVSLHSGGKKQVI